MNDPQRERLYRAEESALGGSGLRFRRWRELERWVEGVVSDPAWIDGFPSAPLDVAVLRRSRSARSSVAEVDRAAIHIREGSWDAATVLHELAHLAAPVEPPHGSAFATTELRLVRSFLGFHAYGALMSSFEIHRVRFDR